MRTLSLLASLSFCTFSVLPVQAQNPPVAKPGPRAGIVLSPFVGKEIDVTGLAPGSLALDPHTKRAFRIPAAPEPALPRAVIVDDSATLQSPAPQEKVPSQESEAAGNQSASNAVTTVAEPRPEPDSATSSLTIPGDLAEFVKTYVKSGASNQPEASAAFYAPRVSNYFGQQNLTRSQILSDRVRYLRLYTDRSYQMKGEPRIVKADASSALVEADFSYSVGNTSRTRRGSASTVVTVRNFEGAWQITAVEEKKR